MVRGIFVRVKEGESPESAIRRLKRSVEKEGKPRELRQREFHRKASDDRKRRKAAAIKRHEKKKARELQAMRGNNSSH